jgi:hypothetical protein
MRNDGLRSTLIGSICHKGKCFRRPSDSCCLWLVVVKSEVEVEVTEAGKLR